MTTLATLALSQLDDVLQSVTLIDSGATSAAYKVVGERDTYALRVPPDTTRKPQNYEVDFGVREQLRANTTFAARPLLTNASVANGGSGSWILDEFCDGTSPQRADIPAQAARQIGELLRELHALPVTGFGKLKNHRRSFFGIHRDARAWSSPQVPPAPRPCQNAGIRPRSP